MFDRLNEIAAQAATSISRRHFLGTLGKAALAAAAMAAGLVAPPAVAQAARPPARVCSANSFPSCAGQPEGTPCFADDAFGRCVGPRRRGDKSTVTTCFCDTR